MKSRNVVIRVGKGNSMAKAMESETQRAPAPNTPEFRSFLVSHNGKNLSHGIGGLKNPIRFNSIRVAQALKRRGNEPISAADFYRVARGRGVSAEELAWGGLHPSMHEHLPKLSPAMWQAHIGRHMPEFKMRDETGYNEGIFGNKMLRDYIDQGGHGHVLSHQLEGEPLDVITRQWRPDAMRRDNNRGTISLTMHDPLDEFDVHSKIRHKRTGAHGNPHILSYKAFEHQAPDGHRALIIDQVQSNSHQNKPNNKYARHTDDNFDEIRRGEPKPSKLMPNAPDEPKDYDDSIVDAPFGHSDNGQWENLALRMALYNASRQGFDSIALPHMTWQNGIVHRSFGDMEPHVVRRNGKTVPQEAAKIVRSLSDFGVTSSVRRFEPFNQDLVHIHITPQLREHYLHNGLTLWDSDNPRDMHRAIKAVAGGDQVGRAPSPTSPEFSDFLAQHDGMPTLSKRMAEVHRSQYQPFRFNSIRVAQALKRRNAGKMSAADFYRNATGRGVSKEELAWAGLHPTQHESLGEKTPAQWLHHIQSNLPVFSAGNQNGMNMGMLWSWQLRDHDQQYPRTISRHRLDASLYGNNYWNDDPDLAYERGTSVSIRMSDKLGGGHALEREKHRAVGGHGNPHILSYKAFGYHPDNYRRGNGEEHLMMDQIQSDWHQKKDRYPMLAKFHGHEDVKFPQARAEPAHTSDFFHFADSPFGRHGQWENLAIRHALYNAAMQGFDSLGLPPSESPWWKNGFVVEGNKLYDAHLMNRYGIVVPQQVDKIVRELGDFGVHTFQREFEPTGQTLTHIRITPALREHYRKHGMTLWESDNPRDMHRAVKAIRVRTN